MAVFIRFGITDFIRMQKLKSGTGMIDFIKICTVPPGRLGPLIIAVFSVYQIRQCFQRILLIKKIGRVRI